jgi:NADPH:quinone reductase-like Zn-dependent oxidoreductase
MRAAIATSFDADEPLNGLTIGEHPDPTIQDGWIRVQVKAASLNHHDVWTLRGVACPADRLPIVLGTDAAGVLDDGREVIVHSVIGDASGGDETLDPKRSLLSEVYDGTIAEYVTVPARNVIDKPDFLTFEEASCLPTAWLTAYRMLFTKSGLKKGDTVLIQGAGGGVATALIQLAHAAGFTVWVTSRDQATHSKSVANFLAKSMPSWKAWAKQHGHTRCALFVQVDGSSFVEQPVVLIRQQISIVCSSCNSK